MELTFVVLFWLTSIVFTILALHYNRSGDKEKHPVLWILCFVLWNATAISTQQVHYVGYGSQNIIVYDHEMGDWSGDLGIIYMLHGVGVFCLLYFFYTMLRLSKEELQGGVGAAARGQRPQDII